MVFPRFHPLELRGAKTAYVFNPGGFEAGGASQGLYANKYMPSISDTVTKVVGTHTLKAGFFWEWIRNAQPANNDTNGQWNFVSGSNSYFSTGDSYSDEVLGIASHYDETSFNRINDISYNTYEGFVQDDWKATKRLTVNFGLRFTHFQPWGDRLGDGFSIFNTANYAPDCTGAPTFCGFEWHKQDPSVPVGGFPTRALFYQPRFGAAYDLRGNGKTVIRGGWGRFYFHTGQFTNGLDASAGVESVGFGGQIPIGAPVNGVQNNQPILVNPLPTDLTNVAPWCPIGSGTGCLAAGNDGLDTVNFSAVASGPSAVDSKDNKQPHTDSYSFTISQRLPWSSMFEISYVGNRTEDISSAGNGGSAGFNTLNINLVPVGAMLSSANGGVDPNSLNASNFRPLTGYSDLYLTTNNAHANYNGLQAVWVRAKGRYNIQLNYTYSKSLGTVGFYNQFNVNDNYGVLPNNRAQLFNATYSIELGSPLHSNPFLNGVVNGWQLTGITQIESGPNLTGLQGQNFGMSLSGTQGPSGSSAIIPGSNAGLTPDGIAISNVSLLGTPDIQLNPILTCNPAKNLGPHQWINGNCFAAPSAVGQNGPTMLPAIYGPAFFSSDLGLFKNFKITESKSLQFRVSAYNFLNHPLWSFNGNNLNLSYTQDPTTGALTQSNSTFGEATNKQGHRIVELAMKFYF